MDFVPDAIAANAAAEAGSACVPLATQSATAALRNALAELVDSDAAAAEAAIAGGSVGGGVGRKPLGAQHLQAQVAGLAEHMIAQAVPEVNGCNVSPLQSCGANTLFTSGTAGLLQAVWHTLVLGRCILC